MNVFTEESDDSVNADRGLTILGEDAFVVVLADAVKREIAELGEDMFILMVLFKKDTEKYAPSHSGSALLEAATDVI